MKLHPGPSRAETSRRRGCRDFFHVKREVGRNGFVKCDKNAVRVADLIATKPKGGIPRYRTEQRTANARDRALSNLKLRALCRYETWLANSHQRSVSRLRSPIEEFYVAGPRALSDRIINITHRNGIAKTALRSRA